VGKTVTGGSKHEKNIDLFTKDQKRYLSSVLSKGTSKKSKRAYQGFLEEDPELDLDQLLGPSRDVYRQMMGQGDDQAAFKTGVIDPMMQQYNQQVLPATQQRFVDANAGSSSALNQALASGANDLTTQMGSMYLPFMQNQQQMRLAAAQGYAGLANPYINQYNQANTNRLSALSGLSGLAGQQTFSPLISQHEGIMGPLIGAGGMMGAAYMRSSEKVKENIREYSKGLDVVKNLEVKIYDYKEIVGGDKDCVGVIAETVPEEIQAEIQGIKAVDLYGLIGLLINSVKELDKKIEALGGKTCLNQ
jgi:hypothetical protein